MYLAKRIALVSSDIISGHIIIEFHVPVLNLKFKNGFQPVGLFYFQFRPSSGGHLSGGDQFWGLTPPFRRLSTFFMNIDSRWTF